MMMMKLLDRTQHFVCRSNSLSLSQTDRYKRQWPSRLSIEPKQSPFRSSCPSWALHSLSLWSQLLPNTDAVDNARRRRYGPLILTTNRTLTLWQGICSREIKQTPSKSTKLNVSSRLMLAPRLATSVVPVWSVSPSIKLPVYAHISREVFVSILAWFATMLSTESSVATAACVLPKGVGQGEAVVCSPLLHKPVQTQKQSNWLRIIPLCLLLQDHRYARYTERTSCQCCGGGEHLTLCGQSSLLPVCLTTEIDCLL